MSPFVSPRLWRPRSWRGIAPSWIPTTPHPSSAEALGPPGLLTPPRSTTGSPPLPPALPSSQPHPPPHRTHPPSTANQKRARLRRGRRRTGEVRPPPNRAGKKLHPQVLTQTWAKKIMMEEEPVKGTAPVVVQKGTITEVGGWSRIRMYSQMLKVQFSILAKDCWYLT